MKSKLTRQLQIPINMDLKQKRLIEKKADEEGIKPATYLKSCLVKYLRSQGEDF